MADGMGLGTSVGDGVGCGVVGTEVGIIVGALVTPDMVNVLLLPHFTFPVTEVISTHASGRVHGPRVHTGPRILEKRQNGTAGRQD